LPPKHQAQAVHSAVYQPATPQSDSNIGADAGALSLQLRCGCSIARMEKAWAWLAGNQAWKGSSVLKKVEEPQSAPAPRPNFPCPLASQNVRKEQQPKPLPALELSLRRVDIHFSDTSIQQLKLQHTSATSHSVASSPAAS
jgi:hypothetical protein